MNNTESVVTQINNIAPRIVDFMLVIKTANWIIGLNSITANKIKCLFTKQSVAHHHNTIYRRCPATNDDSCQLVSVCPPKRRNAPRACQTPKGDTLGNDSLNVIATGNLNKIMSFVVNVI